MTIGTTQFFKKNSELFSRLNEDLKSQIEVEIPTFNQYANVSSKLINDFFSLLSFFHIL